MRARWLSLAALVAALPALAGCGGVGVSAATENAGNQLAVYSSLPLQGPDAAISAEIVNGERLALSQVGGRIGVFKVGYVSLDDANPKTGELDPSATATDAKMAAQDTSTIAYLGEYSSAATAVSLPLINAAGILQVSPGSPYVGLTSSRDAGQDEPERFYPSGKRTFARLQPGDPAQAVAQAQLMHSLGVHRLYVLDDQDPFEVPLAELVIDEAERAGVAVAGHDSIATTRGSVFTGEVEKIEHSGADAVFFAGGPGAGTVALWRALHEADPTLALLGSSSLSGVSFTSAIGAAALAHLHHHADARAERLPAFGTTPARAVPRAVRRPARRMGAVRLRGDERRARRDPPGRRARQRPAVGDRRLLRLTAAQLGARPLLLRSRRRTDVRAVWRRSGRRRKRPVLPGDPGALS